MHSSDRPVWPPYHSYYGFVLVISLAFLFTVWLFLHDEGDSSPLFSASMAAGMLVFGAVIFREVVLRRSQRRMVRRLAAERQRTFHAHPDKISVEQNAAILKDIKVKSDAAKVLGRLPAAHREVIDLCDSYLRLNEQELKNVNPGSPRLAPLLKGRTAVSDLHRFHTLRWAELESTSRAGEARNGDVLDDRIRSANEALDVIDEALEAYPAEQSLTQSKQLLQELVVSMKVTDWVEKAERAEFSGDYKLAKSLYKDALFYLGRDNIHSKGREQAAERINAELERIRQLERMN